MTAILHTDCKPLIDRPTSSSVKMRPLSLRFSTCLRQHTLCLPDHSKRASQLCRLSREITKRLGRALLGTTQRRQSHTLHHEPAHRLRRPQIRNGPQINVHVDRKARPDYIQVVNLHVVKYIRVTRTCLYMWDSRSRKTVLDNCFDSFSDLAK